MKRVLSCFVMYCTLVSVYAAEGVAAEGKGFPWDMISPGDKATGKLEGELARKNYSPSGRIIDPFLFPVRAEMRSISRPPGLTYRDLATRQQRNDIYAMVYYPHDWQPSDQRPVTVYAYGSGWNGVRRGQPQSGAGAAAYWSRFGGMVVVSTHYRSGLKESMADGVSAVRWTRKHAGELGIAPDRVTGGGGSSGGHIMLSTTLIENGPENPWDDKSIPKACQYHYGQVAVPSRPKHPELSPAHQLRDGLPPYIQVIGTADKAWGEFAYEFKRNAEGKDLPFWFLEYEGGGHGWKGPANYRVKYQVVDFLLTYGAMDRVRYVLRGAKVDLGSMAAYYPWQGLEPGMKLSVDRGGTIRDGNFVDDGKVGMSIVTATSTDDPSIKRHSYLAVGQQLWAEDANRQGEWKESSFNGKRLLQSTDDEASLHFEVELPQGDWMLYAIRWKEPYFSHTGMKVQVTGGRRDAEALVDLSRQQPHMHIPLTAFQTDHEGKVQIQVSRGAWNEVWKKPKSKLPLACWGLVILPRYSGGESGLAYKRGHLRYESFPLGKSEQGDRTIGP